MLHPFKVVAFAVVAACAASMAAAQNPGDVSNTTTAGTATAETLERSRFRRQLPPPGGWPAPQYQRVCAWRADGLPVISFFRPGSSDLVLAKCASAMCVPYLRRR